MAYGTQININGSNMVSMIEPAVFIDMILTASGSRTYDVPEGYTLQYLSGVDAFNRQPSVTISGNKLTWSGGSTVAFIFVFIGR